MNHLCLITNEPKDLVREFVEYHRPLFNAIHIYNNGKDLYKIENVFEYDVRSVEAPQVKCYNDCFNKINIGDTITFLDTDERLMLEQDLDSLFRMFPLFDVLHYSWQITTDNGLTTRDPNKTLMEQFTEIAPMNCVYNADLPNNITENYHHKFTVRKSWKPTTINIHTAHIQGGLAFDMNGVQVSCDSPWSKPIWSRAYVRHFLTQDTTTFCERRLGKLDACGNSVGDIDKLKSRYFNLNKRTKEKEGIFDAYTSRINKDVEPVSSECDNVGISYGTQPGDTNPNSGTVKQVNGTVHTRVKRRTEGKEE